MGENTLARNSKPKSKPRRPERQKKSDRLTNPAASAVAIKIDMMMAPLTLAVDEADRRWGIDRLPELVAVDTAAKWGLTLAKLSEAIDAEDAEKAAQWTGAALRGLAFMEAEASAGGALRACSDVWEVELNGVVYGIMRDGRAWQEIREQRPDLRLLTLREVAVAVEWWSEYGLGKMQAAVADAFPAAEVIRSRPGGSLEDDIGDL